MHPDDAVPLSDPSALAEARDPIATESSTPPPPTIVVTDVAVTVDRAPLLGATSLRASAGDIVALRGENGAGKTTLLRVLAGRTVPTVGSARIAGRAADERDPRFRRSVAVMIGLPPFAPDLTVQDHLALVALTWMTVPREVEDRVAAVMDEFALSTLATRYPHELSSGQTQLFALALVFVRPFDVLLLDEPEQRLDPRRRSLLAAAMRSRSAAGATIVAATHSEGLIAETAARMRWLETSE